MSRAEQMERFLEAAQALGCDSSEDFFGEIVRAIALARPGPPPTAPAAESAKHARPRRVSAESARRIKGAKSTKRNAEGTNDAALKGATLQPPTTKSLTIKNGTAEARRNPKGSANPKADQTFTDFRAAKGPKAATKQSAAKSGASMRAALPNSPERRQPG
jgi:hypothetical protein